MIEIAQEIFDYLPIRRNTPENDYIEHLWQSFNSLEEAEDRARPFAVMPFHLLFMMATQYKTIQIAATYKQASDLFFSGVGGRSKKQLLSTHRSVFDMALVNERTIPEIFQLINLAPELIKKFKALINKRNDTLAHAKGGIEQEIEAKIGLYINLLEQIQKKCFLMNQGAANIWLEEVQPGDNMEQFLEIHFFASCFSPRDFSDVIKVLLEDERLDFEQWGQTVSKGLELAYYETILALKYIAKNDLNRDKRFNAVLALNENDEIDGEFKISISKKEQDEDILSLLN